MTLLGKDLTTNKDVSIDEKDRSRGVYIIGKTGFGKSILIENMAVQDIEAGQGVCILDPHGSLIDAILVRTPDARLKDVILLDFLGLAQMNAFPGLNLFACSDPTDPVLALHTVDQIEQIFQKVFGAGVETPRLNQFVRNIAYTLIGQVYTMAEIPNLLLDASFRKRFPLIDRNMFWKSYESLRPQEQLDRSESTLDRISSLTDNPIIKCIVGQSHTTIDFKKIMDEGKILLVLLPGRYEAFTSLLGSIIIGQLLTAALGRTTSAKRKPFCLFADEYARFATPDFAVLLSEARKFSVQTTIAHQFRAQLDEKNAGAAMNAGTLISFRLTPEDAEEIAPAYNLQPPQAMKPPGTTPADILNHLTDHPSQEVKRFWTMFVKRMMEAKTVTMPKPLQEFFNVLDEWPYPYFLIQKEKVYFDPEYARQLLDMLQHLFYNSSRAIPNNGELMKEALLLYLDMIKSPRLIHRDKAFNTFADELKDALYEVYKSPIEVATTEWQTTPTVQQTYADRKNQIANLMVQFPIGQAMVKTPDGEHIMRTIMPTTDKGKRAALPTIRQRMLDQTARTYCKSRQEVEEEIRHRQEPPHPPVQQKYTI